MVALAAVLFGNISLHGFARHVHFRSLKFHPPLHLPFPEKIILAAGIRGLLATMNRFHDAGITVAKERTGQSSGFKLLAN